MKLCCWCTILVTILAKVCCNPPTTRGSLCLPGNEWDSEKSECIPCEKDFYSKNGVKCVHCAKCHKGQAELHKCEPTSNTRCICGEGKYEKDGICKDCINCPAGLFQKRDCGHNLNRQCEECPKGYNTNHTNAKQCLPNKHDKNTPPPTTTEYHIYKYDWKLIFSLIAVTSTLLLGAIIFYCIRRRKRRRARKNENNNNTNVEDDPTTGLLYPFPDQRPDNHVLVDELCYNVVESLAFKLNPNERNNWRTLASYLGISTERVKNIALRPQEATQELLNEWGVNRNATVFILCDILRNYMKREDAAEILKPFIYNEHDSTV